MLLQVKANEMPMSICSNLIIFISKNGEKIPKNHNFFEFFHLLNPFGPSYKKSLKHMRSFMNIP